LFFNVTVALVLSVFHISHALEPQHYQHSLVRIDRCIRTASILFIAASSAVIITIWQKLQVTTT